jgi:para-nitrobenzyl esterase
MKKIYTLLAAAIGFASTAYSQCYPVIKTTEVVYSTVLDSTMDIYTPVGAPAGQRPLLVMAHGGSFSAGSKEEGTSSEIARRFASRGYTTASINYRLETSTFNLVDSTVAAGAVLHAVSDMKAAVRFFSKDARGANFYKVDTLNMYVGGNSAGAIAAVNLAYLEDTNDIQIPIHQYVRDVVRNNGGINGNSGNDGYYDKVAGVLNFAGGVKDTNWIRSTGPKIFSAHGNKDRTVPYGFDRVLNSLTQNGLLATVITLCGSGAMEPRLTEKGVTNRLQTYVNADHVPWEASTAIFNEIDSLAAEFLGAPDCYETGFYTSIAEAANAVEFGLYPNPSNGTFSVKLNSTDNISKIVLTDNIGRTVTEVKVTGTTTTINRNNLAAGYYSVTLVDNNGKTVGIKKAIVQ